MVAGSIQMDIPDDYPEKIKQIRETRGLTQEALAEYLGCNVATVNRWEKGRTKLTDATWRKLKQLAKSTLVHWPVILKTCRNGILGQTRQEQIAIITVIQKICSFPETRKSRAIFMGKNKDGTKYWKYRFPNGMRLIFQGPKKIKGADGKSKTYYFFDFYGSHDRYLRYLKKKGGQALEEKIAAYVKNDLKGDEYPPKVIEYLEKLLENEEEILPNNKADYRYGWKIPPSLHGNSTAMQRAMEDEKVSISLTREQMDIVENALRPILVHGPAGSGKSTVLYHRLASSLVSIADGVMEDDSNSRICFTSYSSLLVSTARERTKSILEKHHLRNDISIDSVEFHSFSKLLLQYVSSNEKHYLEKDRVAFSKFRKWFHSGVGRTGDMTTELAWHIIRSIIKGRIQNNDDLKKVDISNYNSLPRKARDVTEKQYKYVLDSVWPNYCKWMREEKYWDEQDLALEVLSIIESRISDDNWPKPYAEMFVDEAQDLTMIEYKILMHLCGDGAREEGIALTLAGDPLQTINPTGFRWEATKSLIYESTENKRSVTLHTLRKNWRSDFRIAAYTNSIQKSRNFHIGEKGKERDEVAMGNDGDYPQIITITEGIEKKLKEVLMNENLPAKSAIIVWPEDKHRIEQFLNDNKNIIAPEKQDCDLDVYSINDAKGMEYRLVILFKIGSDSDVNKWIRNIVLNDDGKYESLGEESSDLIPLLYFLNRFYVSGTRAMDYLVILDDEEAVSQFWKPLDEAWRDENDVPHQLLQFSDDDEYSMRILNSEIFDSTLYATDEQKREWAQDLYEKAKEQSNLTLMIRARRHFENIDGAKQEHTRCNAYIEKWNGNFSQAAKEFKAISDKKSAVECYVSASQSMEAIEVLETMGHETNFEIMAWHAELKYELTEKTDSLKAAKELHNVCCNLNNHDNRLKPLRVKAAELLFFQSQFDRARDLYELDNNIEMQGRCYIKQQDWQQGIKYLEEANIGENDPDYVRGETEISWGKGKDKRMIVEKLHSKGGNQNRVLQWLEEVLPEMSGIPATEMGLVKAEATFQIGEYKDAIRLFEVLKPTLEVDFAYNKRQIENYNSDIRRKERDLEDAEDAEDSGAIEGIKETISKYGIEKDGFSKDLEEVNKLLSRIENGIIRCKGEEDPQSAVDSLISVGKIDEAISTANEYGLILDADTMLLKKIRQALDDGKYNIAIEKALKSKNLVHINMVFKECQRMRELKICAEYVSERNKILESNGIEPGSSDDPLAELIFEIEFESAKKEMNFAKMISIAGSFSDDRSIFSYLDTTASLMTQQESISVPMKELAIVAQKFKSNTKDGPAPPLPDLCDALQRILNADGDHRWIFEYECQSILGIMRQTMGRRNHLKEETRDLFLDCAGEEGESFSWARKGWIRMMEEHIEFRKKEKRSYNWAERELKKQSSKWRRQGWD